MVKATAHITLALLLILSSTGITLNMHYCHDRLIDMALNAPAQSCCAPGIPADACQHNEDLSHSSHCEDASIRVETAREYMGSAFSYNIAYELIAGFALLTEFTTALKIQEEQCGSGPIPLKEPPVNHQVERSRIQVYLI